MKLLVIKKISSLIIAALFCISLTSCNRCENKYSLDEYSLDDAEFAGVLQGHYEAFMSLWNATGKPETLAPGEPWQTEHFTLTLNDTILPGVAAYGYEDMPGVEFKLNTASLTLEECILDEKFFFCAREIGEDIQQDELLFNSSDLFWGYAESCDGGDYDDYLNGHSCRAALEIDKECTEIQIIIVTDSSIYKALYQTTGNR